MELIDWLISNRQNLLDAIAYIVLAASIIVKLTPTLKDDNVVLPIVKFIGKYLALNKYSPSQR